MSTSALEKIAAIEAEAKNKIEALKQEAISEVVRKIAALKSELAALETEYSSLTGKTLKGEKVAGTRRRLTREEKAGLVETVTSILSSSKDGVSLGEIVRQVGESASAVRDALKQVKNLKKTGVKAAMRYSVK